MSGQTHVFSVPDISCGHCKQAIESEVGRVDGVGTVTVDIDRRTVTVDGTAGERAVVGAIEEAGYDVAS